MAASAPNAAPLRMVWRIARNATIALSSNDHLALPEKGLSADTFKKAVRQGLWSPDRRRPEGPATRKQLGAPAAFKKMGPAQRIEVLKKPKRNPDRVNRFIRDNSQRNLLKKIRCSLPSVVSALNGYLKFCQLEAVGPFPITERRVLNWSSVFNDAPTFQNYTIHLQKVCFFLGCSTAWYTPAVKHVAKGLIKCQGKSFKFPNFIRSRLLIRMLRSQGLESESAQACLFSFLFSFRVPSETLMIRRSFNNDRLLEFSHQVEKALVGIRVFKKQPYLAAKLSFRKNHTGGVILKRPCFCGLDNDLPRFTCPVHSLWRAIKQRVYPGEPIFKDINRRNFNRRLKAILARLGIPEARRYSSHGFRMGSAQELNVTGSPLSVVASAGQWRPNAVRGYVNLDAHVESNARHLFRVDMNSESEDDVHPTLGFQGQSPLPAMRGRFSLGYRGFLHLYFD